MVLPTAARPLVIVVGPTGAGKSALGLHIAETFRGEIVNCDSLQFYRGFDIGTAKTPQAERREIPHHLIDVLDGDSVYSAGDYGRDARRVLQEISSRGCLPIVVGGTGFYLRALLDGLPELPGRDEQLRVRLLAREDRKPGTLHRLLQRLEPAAAGRIHHQDLQKTLRALEIRLLTQRQLPESATALPLQGYRVLTIGLSPDRTKLVEMIARRTSRMFDEGLVDEVERLLENGANGTEKPFEALGYKQVLKYLDKHSSLEEAISSTAIETRQYAKRQLTWHRRDSRIRWIPGFGVELNVQQQAEAWVREFLDVEAEGSDNTQLGG